MMARGVETGTEAFTLSVRQDNPAAIHVYKKTGFMNRNMPGLCYIIEESIKYQREPNIKKRRPGCRTTPKQGGGQHCAA
jgi:hypothetical protein